MNLDSAATLVLAVVPFEEVAIGFGYGPESGQLAGPRRALQWTGQHLGERESLQPFPKPACVAPSVQRDEPKS